MSHNVPQKIAFLLSSLKFGGAERVALNLAKALIAEKIQIDFVLMREEGELLVEAKHNFKVVDLHCDRTYKLPGKLSAYLKQNSPDALISSFWKLNLCACLARLVHPRVKLLLWEHSPPSKSKNSPKWLYAISASLLYHRCTKIVAVSTGVFDDISRWTFGLRHKLIVIFNPIAPPSPRHHVHSRPSNGKQVVWVGRLEDPKNPGLVLAAFALVPKHCNATLTFVGDGRLRAELEQKCQALGLRERVSFLGFLADPYEVIAVSDLLVVSSDREGLPSVIIEGMYCGLRVVSTDCGLGVHDILLDNRYGTIVPVKDKYALARAIESELKIAHAEQEQIDGAQRFLPQLVAQQFLANIR